MKLAISSGTKVAVFSVVVGIVGGYGAIGFRYLIHGSSVVFFEWTKGPLAWMGDYRIVLLPALGALFVGLLTHFVAGESKGHGVPVVLEAMATKGGRIRPRVSIVTALASALCIGSGGSAGREGPIVQIGAAFGSTVGQLFKLPASVTKTLVAAGAAAGISGTFNAPFAGVFFGLEVILRQFSQTAFGSLVLASVAANVICLIHLGDAPAFVIPKLEFQQPAQLPFYVLLGCLCGVLAVLYTKIIYFAEDQFERIRRVPPYLLPVLGGAVMGVIAFWMPETMDFRPPGTDADFLRIAQHAPGAAPTTAPGTPVRESLHPEFENSYTTTVAAIKEGYIQRGAGGAAAPDADAPLERLHVFTLGDRSLIPFLFLLALVKIVATAFTLGAGGSGGVFAPGLYVGATFGAGFGHVLGLWWPSIEPGTYAIVGMAAVFSGFAQAPITAILMLFEMTDDYYIILPLMIGVVVSTVVARKIRYPTMYTEKLLRRGIDVDALASATTLELTAVRSAMSSDVPTIRASASLDDIVVHLTEQHPAMVVVGPDDKLCGVLTFADLKGPVHERSFVIPLIAEDLIQRAPVTIAPDATLAEAITSFGVHDVPMLPVVDPDDPDRVVGVLHRRDVIAAYDDAVRTRNRQ